MNLKRVLQPYVCCIGNPVAGNPTQFVMYRAARAAGIDWRFFTSQVAIDQFQTAFRGVQALGLDGVAILDPFQAEAVALLDSVTESALTLGKVNVARSDGNSWLGDNTLGAAICRIIGSSSDQSVRSTPSAQDSVVEKDALSKDSLFVTIDSPEIARAIQLGTSEYSKRVISVRSSPESLIAEAAKSEDKNLDSQNVESSTSISLDSLVSHGKSMEFIFFGSTPTANQLKQLSALQWTDSGKCLILDQGADGLSRTLRAFIAERSLTLIEPVELLAHQAAADFHFWTGVTPSVELIRESLEEYLQW